MAKIVFKGDWKKKVTDPGKYFASNFKGSMAGRLGLRVSRKSATWFLDYRLNDGRRQTYTIGRLDGMPFSKASAEGKGILEKVRNGGDPRAEDKASLAAPTIDTLFQEYYKFHAVPNKAESSVALDAGYYRRLIKPTLGKRKVADVKKRDIIRLLDTIGQTSPITRNRVSSLLSIMFNVGIDRDLVEVNPAYRIKKVKEVSRDRVLTSDEIKSLWEQWDRVRMGNLFKIKLLTAQRDTEICSMKWDDITDGTWTIPADISKNGKPHLVPLPHQVQDILGTILRRGTYVFYSARGKTGHVTSTKKCFRECRDRAGLPKDTRGHDFRRTAATEMVELGVSNEIIGMVLNHSNNSVRSIYNRSKQSERKRIALQKWADHVDRILDKDEPDPTTEKWSQS